MCGQLDNRAVVIDAGGRGQRGGGKGRGYGRRPRGAPVQFLTTGVGGGVGDGGVWALTGRGQYDADITPCCPDVATATRRRLLPAPPTDRQLRRRQRRWWRRRRRRRPVPRRICGQVRKFAYTAASRRLVLSALLVRSAHRVVRRRRRRLLFGGASALIGRACSNVRIGRRY